jgi:hypothetical protein
VEKLPPASVAGQRKGALACGVVVSGGRRHTGRCLESPVHAEQLVGPSPREPSGLVLGDIAVHQLTRASCPGVI